MAEGVKLGINDAKKFIIESAYNTVGVYPSGIGAAIVLCTVSIDYKERPNDTNSHNKSKSYNRVYKNKDHKNHAKGNFLHDLIKEINKLPKGSVAKITASLVQNYSPCNNRRDGNQDARITLLDLKRS